MARSSIGIGYQALILARRVRLPHGLLNMTKWRNWKTLDAQNVVPQGMGVRLSPWSLSDCRRGRCPTGFHKAGRPVRYRGLQLRVGVGSTGSHKPGLPGATPGPATTGYANRKSDQFERLVILWVRLPLRSLHDPLVQWQRHLGDNQESAGSIPAGITVKTVCRCFGSTPPR